MLIQWLKFMDYILMFMYSVICIWRKWLVTFTRKLFKSWKKIINWEKNTGLWDLYTFHHRERLETLKKIIFPNQSCQPSPSQPLQKYFLDPSPQSLNLYKLVLRLFIECKNEQTALGSGTSCFLFTTCVKFMIFNGQD